jgi:hypothetical protein
MTDPTRESSRSERKELEKPRKTLSLASRLISESDSELTEEDEEEGLMADAGVVTPVGKW